MIGIVIITHGTLSEQLLKTAGLILGDSEKIETVSFTAKESLESLKKKSTAAINRFADEGCLVLTDILGGSASNVCVEMMQNDNVQVLTGTNLPMLLEAIGSRHTLKDLNDLANKVQDSGQQSIINLKKFFDERTTSKR